MKHDTDLTNLLNKGRSAKHKPSIINMIFLKNRTLFRLWRQAFASYPTQLPQV